MRSKSLDSPSSLPLLPAGGRHYCFFPPVLEYPDFRNRVSFCPGRRRVSARIPPYPVIQRYPAYAQQFCYQFFVIFRLFQRTQDAFLLFPPHFFSVKPTGASIGLLTSSKSFSGNQEFAAKEY